MNERTHFIKNLSHVILERVDVSVVCERWVKRHILRQDFFPYHLPGARGCHACKLVRDASDRLRVPRSTPILCTLSKFDCVVLITWYPSGYTPVVPECPNRTAVYKLCDSLPKHTGSLGTKRKYMSYVI